MSLETQRLERLQQELKFAFKWMGMATEYSQKGDFSGSAYCMTVALQHWQNCQHYDDKYISEELKEKIDWKFFANKALVLAKNELKEGE
jgi:hypothetical protein